MEIDLDPSKMRPATGSTRAPVLSVQGSCRYPDGRTATLHLCKLALPETAAHMNDLLAVASERDAAVAALANGAQYAGDPDPYKKPVVIDEDDDDLDDEDDIPPTTGGPNT